MKKLILIIVILFSVFSVARAEDLITVREKEKFKRFNPDGKKYQFLKDYITALTYLKQNNERFKQSELMALSAQEELARISIYREDLIQDNANLRIARNYLEKYRSQTENGLILQASDVFIQSCNSLIDQNENERKLLESLYLKQNKEQLAQGDVKVFLTEKEKAFLLRKETYKNLLRNSVLVNKILISNKENKLGKFDTIGLTQEQRYKLISILKIFNGKEYEGELREGQSFLEASVLLLKEFLEDSSWKTLDG